MGLKSKVRNGYRRIGEECRGLAMTVFIFGAPASQMNQPRSSWVYRGLSTPRTAAELISITSFAGLESSSKFSSQLSATQHISNPGILIPVLTLSFCNPVGQHSLFAGCLPLCP